MPTRRWTVSRPRPWSLHGLNRSAAVSPRSAAVSPPSDSCGVSLRPIPIHLFGSVPGQGYPSLHRWRDAWFGNRTIHGTRACGTWSRSRDREEFKLFLTLLRSIKKVPIQSNRSTAVTYGIESSKQLIVLAGRHAFHHPLICPSTEEHHTGRDAQYPSGSVLRSRRDCA